MHEPPLQGNWKWQPPGDPQLQADALFWPLCLLYSVAKEAPQEQGGKEASESKQTLQLDRKTSKKSKQRSQDMVFLKNRDIVDGTSFLRLLFFPLFFWASQGRGGFWRLYPSPTATIILCPSTPPRVQDQGVVWTSIKDKDHVLMSMTGGLCSKHSIFPSCVSPLLLIQNASLLTLPVTKCVKIFPTLSNFPQYQSSVV